MATKTVDKDFLRFYRFNKNDMPQPKLIELTGYQDISSVEKGNVVLSYDNAKDREVIKRIAKALEVQPTQLFCLDAKAAVENSIANEYALRNLRKIRRIRHISEKNVGLSLGFPDKRARPTIIEFDRRHLMFPPDELTRIASEIFAGDSNELHELQKGFLTRLLSSAEIEHIYSNGTEQEDLQQENKVDEFENADDFDDFDDVDIGSKSGENAEYELHLADGRVITVKGPRYDGDICYEFYIARKKAVLEYVQDDGSIFICRKKDIYYIIRKGDEK